MVAHRTWLVPFALFLFALAIRIGIIWHTGFDGLYGQDPFAYLDYSIDFKTALLHGQFPPPFFWPVGYPALVMAFSFVLPVPIAAQVVSVIASVLVALLVFRIVREILGDQSNATTAALFAGGIVACSGRLLISSLIVMSDAAALLWATVSMYGVIRYGHTRRWFWLALAGFTLGLAISTRWVYALLLPIWISQQPFRVWKIFGAFGLLALLPQIILLARVSSPGDLAFMGDAQVYNWNLRNAFQSNMVNADGHFTYAWTIGSFYSLPLIHPDYMSIWFTPFVFLGAWSIRHKHPLLILLLGWFVAEWGFLIGVPWENWRFPLAFFPPLAIFAGIGLREFVSRVRVQPIRFASIWLAICFITTLGWGLYDAEGFIARQLDERAVATWVGRQLPPNATVLTFNATATLAHFTPFRVIELASETPGAVEKIARQSRNVFIVLNVENVESQWQGLAPQINFQTLQNGFAVRAIGTRGAYTLYTVNAR